MWIDRQTVPKTALTGFWLIFYDLSARRLPIVCYFLHLSHSSFPLSCQYHQYNIPSFWLVIFRIFLFLIRPYFLFPIIFLRAFLCLSIFPLGSFVLPIIHLPLIEFVVTTFFFLVLVLFIAEYRLCFLALFVIFKSVFNFCKYTS